MYNKQYCSTKESELSNKYPRPVKRPHACKINGVSEATDINDELEILPLNCIYARHSHEYLVWNSHFLGMRSRS